MKKTLTFRNCYQLLLCPNFVEGRGRAFEPLPVHETLPAPLNAHQEHFLLLFLPIWFVGGLLLSKKSGCAEIIAEPNTTITTNYLKK